MEYIVRVKNKKLFIGDCENYTELSNGYYIADETFTKNGVKSGPYDTFSEAEAKLV